MKRSLALLALFCFLLALFGCTEVNTNETVKTSAKSTDGSSDEVSTLFYPLVEAWPKGALTQRETWNIELSFYEIKGNILKINAIDHDNIGFFYSDYYSVLEYRDGDEWVDLTKKEPEFAWYALSRITPHPEKDYVTTRFFINLKQYSQTENLKSGHYRITKILDNKPFSCEFDLNFD